MNKTEFICKMLDQGREVVALAFHQLQKDSEFLSVFCQDPEQKAIYEVAETMSLTLNRWCCFTAVLRLLGVLRSKYLGKYNVLLFDDAQYALMDSYVIFYNILFINQKNQFK